MRWLICWFYFILISWMYTTSLPLHRLFYHRMYIFCLDITMCHCLLRKPSFQCLLCHFLSKWGHSCSSILFLKLLAFAYKHMYLCFVPILGTHLSNTQLASHFLPIYIPWPILYWRIQNFQVFLFSKNHHLEPCVLVHLWAFSQMS